MTEAELPDTLPRLLAQVVACRGDHPAIITADEIISYTELDRRTGRLARALLEVGVGKGTRIAMLAPDGPFWVIGFLAALRIGALMTPISTLSTPPELAHVLRHGDIQLLIGVRRFLRHDYGVTLAAALPSLATSATEKIHPSPSATLKPPESEKLRSSEALRLKEAPYLRRIWLDDAEGLSWARPFDELLATGSGNAADDLLHAAEAQVVSCDPAVVVYTSGSTAQPKAVVHSHWPIARHSPELARQFALRPDDRMMCLLPLFWLAGLSTMLQVVSVGATQIYPRSPEISDAIAMIANHRVTRVNAWGDRGPLLREAASRVGVDLSGIPDLSGFRATSGELLPPRAAMYGMTESFSAHSAEPVDVPLLAAKAQSFGRAINGYERRVVDPETGAEVIPGEVGELQIRGPALMLGLYKTPRENVFTEDGFYPTWDLVHIDADGHLYPAGRRDDMIKSRGANVSRLEVEAALIALPGVREAAVAGIPDAQAGKLVVAAVVPEAGAALSEEKLQSALRASLSSYKVPRAIVFVSAQEIPRTATGKLKIGALAEFIAGRLVQRREA